MWGFFLSVQHTHKIRELRRLIFFVLILYSFGFKTRDFTPCNFFSSIKATSLISQSFSCNDLVKIGDTTLLRGEILRWKSESKYRKVLEFLPNQNVNIEVDPLLQSLLGPSHVLEQEKFPLSGIMHSHILTLHVTPFSYVDMNGQGLEISETSFSTIMYTKHQLPEVNILKANTPCFNTVYLTKYS